VGKKRVYQVLAQVFGTPILVINDLAPKPLNITLFGSEGETMKAKNLAALIQLTSAWIGSESLLSPTRSTGRVRWSGWSTERRRHSIYAGGARPTTVGIAPEAPPLGQKAETTVQNFGGCETKI